MIKVISFNANGIRSAFRKGFGKWALTEAADFICIQETKAQLATLGLADFELPGYQLFFKDALKPGYSGVAIYTRHQPQQVVDQLGFPLADEEGRYLRLDFPHLSVVSLYLPSGSSGEARQAKKYEFMAAYETALKARPRAQIICGDWNIVHKEIDIKNWKSNQKNSGCLPQERAWLDQVFGEFGWVDGFRVVNSKAGEYTWWSLRHTDARAHNVGWRIDYQVVTPELAQTVKDARIYKEDWFSDHAPVVMTYELDL